jgi:hypothetical protein
MIIHDHTGIKYVGIHITKHEGGQRHIFKITRRGQVLGYVARSLTTGAPIRAGWSYCTEPEPEVAANWTQVGPGSTREDATDHLLSALSPSAAWLK